MAYLPMRTWNGRPRQAAAYRWGNRMYGMKARRIQSVYRGWKNRRTAATNRYLMVRKRPMRYIRRY